MAHTLQQFLSELELSDLLDSLDAWTVVRVCASGGSPQSEQAVEWIAACRHEITRRIGEPVVLNALDLR